MISKKIFINFLVLFSAKIIESRNLRRTPNPYVPEITVSASNNAIHKEWILNPQGTTTKKYRLKSSFLRLRPIKQGFNETVFKQHYMPEESITCRTGNGIVEGSTLSKIANELIEEIKAGKKDFTSFKVLKDSGFNYKTLSGLIVLKYKNYPFVIKVSIEHPHTMIDPFSKSYEATGIFLMGGNLRHLSNFTRITNLEHIKQLLCYNPFYLYNVDFPRKWYWKPENGYNLEINWRCGNQKEKILLPSIYAVISDFIITEENQPTHELNRLSMKVATDVGFLIDPHAGNILIEKGSRKYVLLDTEDFRLMTGLDTPMNAKKYIGWYIELVTRAIKNCLFKDKQERMTQSMQI
ncbi:hypothetical protein HYV10_03485 [Candidatus Dependentiae bacterium]|nr:hypothetical protein [Candidatus Dependentiae bacterium]